MNYWQRRNLRAQEAVSNKSIKEIEKQLAKYYRGTAKRVMRDFEATYDKLLATAAAGRAPTPADLYKLDKYWKMQGQLQRELQKLGDQSVKAMQEAFVKQFTGVYNSLALPGGAQYTTVSRETALQMINSIWCADGKAWSARVWANTDLLQETLNEQLVHCVVTGKKPTELKNLLQERFNVSYSQADTLVRTETAHIQTQAAQKRYEDYGIKEVEVWVDEDERTCPICAKHEGERYGVNDKMPVPFHPRCRCCMIPVVEIEATAEEQKPAETPTVEKRTRRPREGYKRILEEPKLTDIEEAVKYKNRYNQDIEFAPFNTKNKRVQKLWDESVDVIKKLIEEYETDLIKVKKISFGGGFYEPGAGIMNIGDVNPYVAIHEFGHTISTEWKSLSNDTHKEFWKELKKLKRKYEKETANNPSAHISLYAVGNTAEEYMAEAFTLAKLRELQMEIPSKYGANSAKYADEVLALINKYFKKKKKKRL